MATPRKIRDIGKLRIDVENPEKFRGFYRVITGYGKYRMVRAE